MAVYDLKQTTSHGANSYTAATLTEQHVYGASRIGLIDQTTVVVDGNGTASVPTYNGMELDNEVRGMAAATRLNSVTTITGSPCRWPLLPPLQIHPPF